MYSRNRHNNKHKICIFVVHGNGKALLGMHYIDALNIININIHSVGTEHGGGNDTCCTNKATPQSAGMTQETNKAEKSFTNIDSNLKSDNTDKPIVNNKLSNTIEYYLPGPVVIVARK